MFEVTRMHYALGPFEGCGVLVSGIGEAIYGIADLAGTGGAQIPKDCPSQDAEPDLDLIEPRRMSRGVVEMNQWVPCKPAVILGLVGDIVVQYHVQLGIGVLRHDPVHEAQELSTTLAAIVSHVDQPPMYFQGSEERRRAVTLVLVSMSSKSLPVGGDAAIPRPVPGPGWKASRRH